MKQSINYTIYIYLYTQVWWFRGDVLNYLGPDTGHKTDGVENRPLTSSPFSPLVALISRPALAEPHASSRAGWTEQSRQVYQRADVVISVNTPGDAVELKTPLSHK